MNQTTDLRRGIAPVDGLSQVRGATDTALSTATIPALLAETAARWPDRPAAVPIRAREQGRKLMRVLVTGGAGFIGSHVVDALLAAGHEPAALDDLSSGSRENLPAGVRLFEADIRDAAAVAAACDAFRPEAVCHQAAQMSVSRSVRVPTAPWLPSASASSALSMRLVHTWFSSAG